MKILVIGNGFDLEHGLPTKYKDFLDFMQCINFLKKNTKVITEEYFSYELEKETKHIVDSNVKKYFCNKNLLNFSFFNKWSEEDNTKELIDCANNNIWIKYFIENMDYEREGWIDLESEISNVIKCFEYMKNYSEQNRKGLGWPKEQEQDRADKQELVQKIINYSKLNIETFELIGKKLQQIISMLNDNLNNLICCLEIYLEDCIGKIQVDYIAPDLKNFKPDKVLSFNYTRTHEKNYECGKNSFTYHQGEYGQSYSIADKQYEYIHGQATLSRTKQDNNMVLGIDEYLDDEKKDKELDFIEFKKYYQRIYKRTGLEYNKWINEIKSNSNPNEIYIFGHSLDVTDKDILYKLLVESNREGNFSTKITIFYHDKKAYAQQIVNLVKIITQDKLIERVSGAYPTIIFKQKQERVDSNKIVSGYQK